MSAAGRGPEFYLAGGSTVVITYSDVQGGWTGTGNIKANPLFANAAGPDGIFGTADDDLSFSRPSRSRPDGPRPEGTTALHVGNTLAPSGSDFKSSLSGLRRGERSDQIERGRARAGTSLAIPGLWMPWTWARMSTF